MIPYFPLFKKLERTDEADILMLVESFRLPPYADFYFVNMWIWNTGNDMCISQLHGNLVVAFRDYASREAFLSFIGKEKIYETAVQLIGFSKENYKISYLKLIPEEIALELSNRGLRAEPDESSHDYVYAVSQLAEMVHWTDTKGRNIKRFIEKYPDYQVYSTPIVQAPVEELKELFQRWGKSKDLEHIFDLNEYQAFERLLQLTNENLRVILFYRNNLLLGFTVYERLGNGKYAISRFAKADTSYDPGIYDILNWEEAKILKKEGIKYYNWEQDLGIKRFKEIKNEIQACFFLEKVYRAYLIIVKVWIKKKGNLSDIF